MTFVLLDDKFANHPKTLQAGNEAVGVWARMLAYCGEHLTDGHVPAAAARQIAGKPKPLLVLVKVGYLEVDDAGDFRIHNYLKWNPSAEEVAQRKADIAAKRAASGRKGGQQSAAKRQATRQANQANIPANEQQRGQQNASNEASKIQPPYPYPSSPNGEGGAASEPQKPSPLTEAIEILKSHGLKRDVVASIKDIWPTRESLPDALRCVLDTAPSTITAGYVVSQIRKLADAPEVLEDYRRQKTVRRPVAQEWG